MTPKREFALLIGVEQATLYRYLKPNDTLQESFPTYSAKTREVLF